MACCSSASTFKTRSLTRRRTCASSPSTYPNGSDEDGSISIDYGVIGIPVTFFVNRDGIVQRRWAGVMRETQLRQWIDELVLGIAPTGDTQGENPEGYEPLR